MAQLHTKRYPIRGALWGLLLGLSIAYFLFFEFAVFGFDSISGVATKVLIVVGITMVVGILWAYVAPARKPKGTAMPASFVESPPPAPVSESPPPAPMGESPPPAPGGEAAPPAPDDEEPPAEPTA